MRNKAISLFALLFISISAFFVPLVAYATELPDETEAPVISDDIPDDESFDAPDTDDYSMGGFDDFMTMLEFLSMFGDEAESGEPVTLQNPKPFTPDGQATVVDWANEYDGKEFYTFKTPSGNVFFLVIDHAKTTDNVYFLNAVTESDLMSLAEKAGEPISESVIPPTAPSPTIGGGDESDADEPPDGDNAPPTPPTKDKDGNTGMIIFVIIAVLALGGAGYYMKIVRPKQQAADDDDDEPEDEVNDEDIPFDDDQEETDDDDEDEDDSDFNYSDNEVIEENYGGEENEDE